jgi:glycosyltransferase involved in cell wall biosynthesis
VPFKPLPLFRSPFGRLNQVARTLDLVRLDRPARAVAQRIDEGRYDVAFVHPCRFQQSPGVLRHLRRTPSVYYCQEALRLLYEPMPARPYDDGAVGRRRLLNRVDPLPGLYRRRLRSTDRTSLHRAGTVLVNSRFMAGTIREIYGVEPQVSYLGVDASQFRPLGLEREPFVLSVGSLTPLKGFDFLIEALGHSHVRPGPRLVIVSNFENPPERAYLAELARDRAVEITFVGQANEGDLVRLYNQAQAVLYAPVREPFGLVPLEAMACGTPVVAVAEGGIPESIVHGKTGLLTGRDPVAFAAAMDQLLAGASLARRLGDAGVAHVSEAWTWDRATERLERHLTRAAALPASSPTGVPA